MNSIVKLTSLSLISILLLAGCTGGGTFSNFNLIGSAKDAKESTIGKNDRMVYMAGGELKDVCSEQAKLITDAGWSATEEPRDEGTYVTSSYSLDTQNLVLMCSEQEENAGVKVTLTLQKGA